MWLVRHTSCMRAILRFHYMLFAYISKAIASCASLSRQDEIIFYRFVNAQQATAAPDIYLFIQGGWLWLWTLCSCACATCASLTLSLRNLYCWLPFPRLTICPAIFELRCTITQINQDQFKIVGAVMNYDVVVEINSTKQWPSAFVVVVIVGVGVEYVSVCVCMWMSCRAHESVMN